ncbi:MAG: hypothetical protein AB9846_08725 [Tenuifilaceae bacterium]
MKILLSTISVLLIILLISCENEENIINKSILIDYSFQYSDIIEEENGHSVKNDTILYSFINEDSIVGIRYKYQEISNNTTELIGTETYIRLYQIKENFITFGFTDPNVIHLNDYLLGLKWEVTSLTKEELKIKLHSQYAPAGNAILKCIKK